jgi:integrase/recombinase XerD
MRSIPAQLGFEIGAPAHALRATAAINAATIRPILPKSRSWLDHANIATTRIYDHCELLREQHLELRTISE